MLLFGWEEHSGQQSFGEHSVLFQSGIAFIIVDPLNVLKKPSKPFQYSIVFIFAGRGRIRVDG